MQKIYTLLRNNKQYGPYTLEEVALLALKPLDLVWIEGKSASWQYPTEIDKLKAYLAETLYSTQKQPEEIPSETIQTNPAQTKEADTKPEKKTNPAALPKYIHVSLPASQRQVAEAQEASPADKLEKKAYELYQKVQAYTDHKQDGIQIAELDTKYTRSLDDIKHEYALWLQKQKRGTKKPFFKKSLAIAALVLTAFSVGFIIVRKQNFLQKEIAAQPGSAVPGMNDLKPAEKNNVISHSIDKKEIWAHSVKKEHPVKTGLPETNTPPSTNKESVTTETNNSIIASGPEKELSEDPAIPATAKESRDTSHTASDGVVYSKKEQIDELPLTDKLHLSGKLIQAGEKDGFDGYEVNLQNNSEKLLKVVAVDIFYYRSDGSLLEKKTLYFSDVPPNSALTKTAPGPKQATTAQYQIGLISADGSLYFAK